MWLTGMLRTCVINALAWLWSLLSPAFITLSPAAFARLLYVTLLFLACECLLQDAGAFSRFKELLKVIKGHDVPLRIWVIWVFYGHNNKPRVFLIQVGQDFIRQHVKTNWLWIIRMLNYQPDA